MAQQLQSINLVAPAFKGINTEDSPLAQDPSFGKTHKTTVSSQATLDHTTEHSDVDVTAAQRNSHALALEFWDVKRATLSQPGMR